MSHLSTKITTTKFSKSTQYITEWYKHCPNLLWGNRMQPAVQPYIHCLSYCDCNPMS